MEISPFPVSPFSSYLIDLYAPIAGLTVKFFDGAAALLAGGVAVVAFVFAAEILLTIAVPVDRFGVVLQSL